jgi:predicted permease
MDTSGIVTFGISPQRNGYELPRSRALFDRLEEDLVALPGVTAAASSTTALLAGSVRMTSVVVEGFSAGPGTDDDSRYDEVGPGYFRALGIPVRAGREFTRTDAADAPKVAVVNEAFARKFGLGRDAVGKRMGIMGVDGPPLDIEIVGVVPDFNHSNLRTADAPIYFVPHRQGSRQRPGIMTFYVRSRQPPEQMMPAIRQVVGRHDPNLPVEDLRTMDEQVGGAMVRERLLGVLTGAFAALAVLVSAVGLYGVLAYAVSQRTPEIGLRMALGATRAGVRWMVLRHVGLIAAIGGALGLALALPLARAAQALLFGLEFADATVLAGATLALGLVALAAAYVPAARAARIDPMRALKYE